MSIELTEISNIHIDYSHVYQYSHNSKSTMIHFRFNRLDRKHIDISLSNQSSLYDLYTTIKLQCYKDIYKIKKNTSLFKSLSPNKDFIPPNSNNQLSCIIRDLIVVNEKTQFISIPNDPKVSVENFMLRNPEFFIKKKNKYLVYIIDEKTIQDFLNPTPKPQSFMENIKKTVKKYTICIK